jgi:hypothetical protein
MAREKPQAQTLQKHPEPYQLWNRLLGVETPERVG